MKFYVYIGTFSKSIDGKIVWICEHLQKRKKKLKSLLSIPFQINTKRI